ITFAASLGNLELNAFLPLIADALLGSLDLLTNACSIFRRLCVAGLEADEERCKRHVDGATATLTALVDRIGYSAAQQIAAEAKATGTGVRAVVLERGLLTAEDFDDMISAESVTRLGSPLRKEKQHS
ncbi:MAG TPA: aspartate ammonia-lyase, partial [Geobacteraceae bacterium]|nr:aspartate ammonia-lyase [Geobacteraceae bacterium]